MDNPYQLKNDPYSSHSQIAKQLVQISEKAGVGMVCHVMDVGCSEGFIGSLLPSDRFSFIGIDNNRNSLKKLPPIYKYRFETDIESISVNLHFEIPVDVLIFADVLEHTRNPEECLQRFLKHLKPNGYVIISLPNIANLFIRLSLLLGRFEYQDSGILDKSHLRFFTFRSAWRFCTEGGINLTSIHVTPIPLPLINPIFSKGRPLNVLHMINASITQLTKNLLGYQFVFVGKKESNPTPRNDGR